MDRLQELGERERLNPEAIIEELRSQGRVAEYSANADEIVNRLVPNLHDHDVVAVFSNGKFDGIHDKLLTRLRDASLGQHLEPGVDIPALPTGIHRQ